MPKKQITACWKVTEESLVVSCPSSTGGNYLVGVFKSGENLIVAHTCPAVENNSSCWHVKAAVDAFYKWRWWDNSRYQVKSVAHKIVLKAEWEQIPIPGTIPVEVLNVWG
jgi:hypothetical protein